MSDKIFPPLLSGRFRTFWLRVRFLKGLRLPSSRGKGRSPDLQPQSPSVRDIPGDRTVAGIACILTLPRVVPSRTFHAAQRGATTGQRLLSERTAAVHLTRAAGVPQDPPPLQ